MSNPQGVHVPPEPNVPAADREVEALKGAGEGDSVGQEEAEVRARVEGADEVDEAKAEMEEGGGIPRPPDGEAREQGSEDGELEEDPEDGVEDGAVDMETD